MFSTDETETLTLIQEFDIFLDCLWFDKEIITTAIIVKIGLFEWKTGLNWLSCTSGTDLARFSRASGINPAL
ncbi:MAG: hypothetical protein ACLS36_00750 [Streptococcus sp.]